MPRDPREEERLHEERATLLEQLSEWLEGPMLVLGFVWLVLLVVELTRGLPPLLSYLGVGIWILFIAEFLLKLAIAEQRLAFLKRNWLTLIALVVPALRVFRVFALVRLLGGARGLQLVRVVGSLNRGMGALRRSMRRRGLGYVLGLTLLVIAVGAAGMYAFERAPEGEPGLHSYAEALWWTTMVIMTVGSDFWPKTPEGRLLCLLLAVYGFAVFGYIAASFASFFIGRDAESAEGEVAGQQTLEALREEICALRAELQRAPQEQARGVDAAPGT